MSVPKVTVCQQVELCLPRNAARAWHLELATALEQWGARVTVGWVEGPGETVPGFDALVALQRRLHGIRARGSRPVHADVVLPDGVPADGVLAERAESTGDSDRLRVDLAGSIPGSPGWRLLYDGHRGEAALARALLAGQLPVVTVVNAEGDVVASGRPGSERPGLAAAALDDVLAGCVSLLVAAITGSRPQVPVGALPSDPTTPGRRTRTPAEQALRAVAGAGVRRAASTVLRTPHWRVGWRHVTGPGTLETAQLPAEGWRVLPDDGHHFYADPFPIVVGRRTFLFVEDYDHRVRQGVISVVEFGPEGPLGTPTPVLHHDVHLSYPVVLEDDGELWMIPETSGAGTVELYRASAFPHRWERHAVLLSDIDANDVTPFRHEGRWWLSATVRHGGSCSDTLQLWYADHLTGPWTAHAANPVLIDIASARPGGHVRLHAGRLLRPTQDGRGGYGAALTIAEITRLDPERFEQRIVAHLAPGPLWPGRRLHTLNYAGNLEVIDGSATSWRISRSGASSSGTRWARGSSARS